MVGMWVPGAPSPKQEGEAPQNTSVSTLRAPIYLAAQHPRDGWLFRVLGGGLGCTWQRRVMGGGARRPLTLRQGTLRTLEAPHNPSSPGTCGALGQQPHPRHPRYPGHPNTRGTPVTSGTSVSPAPRTPAARAVPGERRTWGWRTLPARAQRGGPGAPRGRRSRIRSKPVNRRRRGRRRRGALGKCSHPPCAGRRGDYKPHSAAGGRKRREESEEKEEKPGRLRGQSQGGSTWLCDRNRGKFPPSLYKGIASASPPPVARRSTLCPTIHRRLWAAGPLSLHPALFPGSLGSDLTPC